MFIWIALLLKGAIQVNLPWGASTTVYVSESQWVMHVPIDMDSKNKIWSEILKNDQVSSSITENVEEFWLLHVTLFVHTEYNRLEAHPLLP